jgi:hypothetical protein
MVVLNLGSQKLREGERPNTRPIMQLGKKNRIVLG